MSNETLSKLQTNTVRSQMLKKFSKKQKDYRLQSVTVSYFILSIGSKLLILKKILGMRTS